MSGGRQPLAALIVDNPLRDLDGLVLLAATLADRGVRAVLVPMYEQGFDIPALEPDIVVANYVRANNRDLLARYRALGARIVVLDSEGAAGRSVHDYVRMIARMEPASLVDDYCVWGRGRYEALVASQALPSARIHLTGCPRYDFCATPWKAALPPPPLAGGFILVNTNFPLPNPRFARSSAAERRTLQQVWADAEYVAAVDRDARLAFAGMLHAIEALASRFDEQAVVVRPHPFESTRPYEQLRHGGNLQVRQEGTSLQWIHGASLLVHQNCSTAVEAVMLGREPFSLEWLSTEALRLPEPSAVSHGVATQAELERGVAAVLAGRTIVASPGLETARRTAIEQLFFANDGRAADRVADVVLACLQRRAPAPAPPRRAVRSTLVDLAREVIGYGPLQRLRRMAGGTFETERRAAKVFEREQVRAILDRIRKAAGAGARALTVTFAADLVAHPRRYSGKSLHVYGT